MNSCCWANARSIMIADRNILKFFLLFFCVIAFLDASIVLAQDSYYRGKTIRILVGFSPGGPSDTYSRIYARQLPKYIPGNPTVFVENMPGAGGLFAANNLFSIAKPDGLTIGMVSRTQITAQLIQDRNVRFDARKLEWIGAPTREQNVCAIKTTAGIAGIEDWASKRTPLKLGAISSPYSTEFMAAMVLQKDLNIPVRVVSSYKGNADLIIATENGEIDGVCGISRLSTNTIWSRPIAEQRLVIISLAANSVKNDSARRSLQFIENLGSTAFSFALPPGTLRERSEILRRAFQNASKDPEFIAEIRKARLDLNPITGEQIQKDVAQIFEISKFMLAKLDITKGNGGSTGGGGSAPPAAPPPPPPPPPAPKPVPPTGLPSASRGVYWNAWVESQGKVVDYLNETAPVSYTLHLDLSPYRYETLATFIRTIGSTDVDDRVKSTLDQYKDVNQIILQIRAIAIGDQVKVSTPIRTFEPMTVTLERLREPTTTKAKEIESEFLTTITERPKKANDVGLAELANNVRGGLVSFGLTPKRTGCATIAFSVWLRIRESVQPLDHIIFRVPVGQSPTQAPRCDNETGLVRLRGGFGTLLSGALSRAAHPEQAIDAGLHIFEHGAGKAEASVAVLAVKNQNHGAIDVFAWQTDSIISTFIEDQNQLPSHVYLARKVARNDDSDYPYANVAELMKLKLFTGKSDDDINQAQQALKSLQNLVAGKAHARVVARLYSFRDEPLYVPLNLLSAHSGNPILKNPLVVLQPLPSESYPPGRACVAAWTFGIPDQLSEAERASALIKTFTEGNADWLQPRLRNRTDAIRFFETQPPGARQGEGLLLLAHQGHGQLWFDQNDGTIQKENMRRQYPEGSVAILMACSTANQAENNGEILEKLNQRGIQAMVVSPFAVDAEYSAMLAVAFAQEIKAAHKQLSLLELFERAARSVVQTLKTSKDPSIQGAMAEEMAREFLILGDYDLKLCPGL